MADGGRTGRRVRRAQAQTGRAAVFQDEFREDLAHWVHTDRALAEKVLRMVEEVMRTPFSGTGKPEHLRGIGANVWSRRLTQSDRLVYLVRDDRVDFLQCRYHY